MQKERREARIFLNIICFLVTITIGLWPVLKTADTSVGTYSATERATISLLYHQLMPGLAFVSCIGWLCSSVVQGRPPRKVIAEAFRSVFVGCIISLGFLYQFWFKLFAENR